MTTATAIKAIETKYNGYRFRSRLEARWAVFFDSLGVKYEYEKEGFDLGAAGRYLPDFWLPQQNAWFEVKPDYPSKTECLKMATLAFGAPWSVVASYLPDFADAEFRMDDAEFRGAWLHHFSAEVIDPEADFGASWNICKVCGYVGIWPLDAFVAHINEHKPPRPLYTYFDRDSTRLADAFEAAKSARFEHGERGR